MLDGGAVRVAEVLTASGDLVSCIGDVAWCDFLVEVEISDYGTIVEPIVEGVH